MSKQKRKICTIKKKHRDISQGVLQVINYINYINKTVITHDSLLKPLNY